MISCKFRIYGKPVQGCPLWHIPPHYFQLPRFPHNPYENAKLFAVVRNPFDRLISEFFYARHYGSLKNSTLTVNRLNAWVHFFMIQTKEATKTDMTNNIIEITSTFSMLVISFLNMTLSLMVTKE